MLRSAKPKSREPQAQEIPANRRVKALEIARYRLVATITDRDLIMVVTFCAIGLLVTVNVILRFPDLLSVESLEQFPR
jgi:hypothetical protein